MATYTPNYNFYLPVEGDSRSNGHPWAQAINNNFIDLDSRLKLHSDGLGTITNNQGAPNGIATLDGSAKLKIVQLPTIGSDNISGLDASKISGQLLDLQIAAVAASKLTGTLVSSQLGNSIIDQTKMAVGLRVPVVVNTLPTLPDAGYPQGSIVTLSTNNKLYRSTGTTWTAEVPAVDVSGQLSDAQIAAIAAAKLTGQIVGTQITDGAISTPKLAAGSVTAAVIAANTITAAQIAANTITASQIAANTITASQIAANTITSSQIAADSITAASIAAGAIGASELAAGAVIAGKIAAGSIGATEIIAGSITTSLLNFTPVQSTNVVASINASAEGIQINAAKLTLTGVLAVGSAASDVNAGVTTISGGKITAGTITTTQLNFTPVQGTNVIASINASAEGIQINAAKLTLTGVLQVGGAAADVNSGATTISGGKITANTITASQLSTDLAIVNVIRSSNYVAGTSIAAPVGLKLSGTAFTTTFLDGTTDATCQFELGGSANLAGFKTIGVVARSMSAIGDNGLTGTSFRAWYRGSNDPATLGGAPNISTISITRRLWDTTNKNGRIEFKLQPTSFTSNLDGMKFAKIQWYKQDKLPASSGPIVASLSVGASAFYDRVSGGTGSFLTDGFSIGGTVTIAGFAQGDNNGTFLISNVTATRITIAIVNQITNESSVSNVTFTGNPVVTAVATTYEDIPDRLYGSSTDSNALNASFKTAQLMDAGITSGYPAVIVTAYNSSGPSDSHCFYSNTGAADGVALVDNGTSFPAAFSASGATGGSGGGTGGGGGSCPAPEVPILMADGSYKLAGDIRVGDYVVAWDEIGRAFVKEFVTFVAMDTNNRWSISLDNGETGKFAHNHRFLLDSGDWRELDELVPGDKLFGGIRVEYTEPETNGPVVKITVNRVHTYITLGVISHNMKPLN